MYKLKLAAIAVLAVLVVVLVLQNTQPVQTRVFFATVTMPGAVLLLVTGVTGFVIGVLVALMVVNRKGGKLAE